MVTETRRKPAATVEAALAGTDAAATVQSEAAARAAQGEEAGLHYDTDNDDDDDDESSESGKDDDREGRRDLGDAMALEVQDPKNAPASDLTSLSYRDLEELLYKEELTRNVLRLREGLEPLPLSAVALLHLKTQEAAITPARDNSATSQLARKSKQIVKMRPVTPQQQQRTRPPKKSKKDRDAKNEKGFRSDGSFDPCTHPTCRSHHTHPLESCQAKEKEEKGAAGKPVRHHKKRFRWVRETVSDSE